MQAALFTPKLGYYARQDKLRVGRRGEADFYTAASLGPVFYDLVGTGARTLAGEDFCQKAAFIEIGAEPSQAPLSLKNFQSHQRMQLGDALKLSGECVVFSNELFDAQPFDSWRFDGQQWQRMGVEVLKNTLRLAPLPKGIDPRPQPEGLPEQASEGYTIDVPVGAELLLEQLVAQEWKGVFIAFDYGKDWVELCQHHHEGTARAYRHHRQHNDWLADPGEQDITHHIAWDRLENILRKQGFRNVQTLRQEAFFMRYAAPVVQAAIESEDMPVRRTLTELLHPAHMGTKFQVLVGVR